MRKIIIIILSLTLLLLAGYAGFRGYRVWKQKHYLAMARDFMAKADARNARLSLNQVLRANPVNLEGNRLMAEPTQSLRSPKCLLWRSRVVELNPGSAEDRLALAGTAAALRYFAIATNALAGMPEGGKNTAAYHNVAGTVAAAINQLGDAESHFLAASRLEPTNPAPKMNLAVVWIQSSNAVTLGQGRAALRELSGP